MVELEYGKDTIPTAMFFSDKSGDNAGDEITMNLTTVKPINNNTDKQFRVYMIQNQIRIIGCTIIQYNKKRIMTFFYCVECLFFSTLNIRWKEPIHLNNCNSADFCV